MVKGNRSVKANRKAGIDERHAEINMIARLSIGTGHCGEGRWLRRRKIGTQPSKQHRHHKHIAVPATNSSAPVTTSNRQSIPNERWMTNRSAANPNSSAPT